MTPLLEVTDINAAYGSSQVLFGVSLEVRAREVVTLIGRNGMGKSTTVKTIMGMLAPTRGSVRMAGAEMGGGDTLVSNASPRADWRTPCKSLIGSHNLMN